MISQNSEKLKAFLSRLGFNPQKDFLYSPQLSKIGVDLAYESKIGTIYFKYLSELSLDEELPNLHKNIWNENQTEGFVVVSDNTTLLCASKYKPDQKAPRLCQIDSFDYGINTPGFEPEKLSPILKENIDFGFFWEYIRERIKDRKRNSVDYDLLLNLVHLKRDLSSRLSSGKKYILIERCLFLKFLEDRGFLIPQTLINILEGQDSQRLIRKFNEVNKLLNGNIFDDETVFVREDISQNTIAKLHAFFTTDYRNKQIKLFPYKFAIIPVELLSNIYEAFLKAEKQASDGIYYTPPNLVDLVLSETLEPMLKINLEPTCLDFTCGSGIFLVKAFQKLIDKNNCSGDFEKKKELLKGCIFGADKDLVATRISIFSLYLKLIEGEDSKKIRQSIKNDKIKFPKLFGKNILCSDTLFDELNFVNEDGKTFQVFDVVVGNPPWGVNPFKDIEKDKTIKLSYEKQKSVKRNQSSQYFSLKAEDFMTNKSIGGLILNNSNFLMTIAKSFRSQLLKDYTIKVFYELSQANSIFFKKQQVEDLTIGADEPAAVVIFKKKEQGNKNEIKYIKPSLDSLAEFLKIPVIKSSDITDVSQSSLEDDQLWRILAIGDMEDYRLIRKLLSHGDAELQSGEGFSVTKHKKPKEILYNGKYIDSKTVAPFIFSKNKAESIPDDGLKITRIRSGFKTDKKLLIKRQIKKDLRIVAAYDNIGYRFKNDLLAVFSDYDYRLLLSFYNSSLASYFLTLYSAQIGKGTFDRLQTNEAKKVPIPLESDIPLTYKNKLKQLTESVLEAGHANQEVLSEIDEIIFNIYHLKEFEKQRVRDFFDIRYKIRKNAFVKPEDLQKYTDRFRHVFSFILKGNRYLNTKAYISNSHGTGILFVLDDIVDKKEKVELLSSLSDIKEFIAVTKLQLNDLQKTAILRQDKVKLYDQDRFVIIKSNQFQDWTETEAIKDANEEIGEWLKQLPKE
ncbi:MAG: N-6 DNA methylase [Thermodesulfovibrionales bacterium]